MQNPGVGTSTSIGGGAVEIKNSSGTIIDPATEQTLDKIPGFWVPENDYIAATYPSATQEVYTYRLGGSGGTQVATVTVNYVDSTKNSILNAGITKP